MPGSVALGEKQEKFVKSLVESGRYHSKSEVIREGLRLIEERERALQALDLAIAAGLKDYEAGRYHPAEDVFNELDREFAELEPSRA
jgi:antitoxin ParD1/3/4